MNTVFRYRQWVLGLVLVLVIAMFPAFPAQAGLSRIVVDGTSGEEELDEAVWSNPNGDVEGKNQILFFPPESTEDTRLITRSATKYSEYTDKLLDAEFTLNFSELPEGETFLFAMGLNSIESMVGESGTIEVRFFNQQGLKSEVAIVNEDGESVAVAEAVACGNISALAKVVVSLSSSKNLKVSVGGKIVCDTVLDVDGDGNVGFLQSGSCSVEVSEYVFTFYQYDRPENTNLVEDFEKGYFNANLLHSKLITGTNYSLCKIQVEEYEGSNVLMFKNVALGYIGTRHQYSNFELTFDVPYLQTVTEQDENGEVIIPRSAGFGITFGDDSVEYATQSFATSADLVVISGLGAYSRYRGASATVEKHPFGAVGAERSFSVRFSVIDGIVTVGVKWLEETEYEDFLVYALRETPTGYVHIWAPTGSSTSFAVDNIKIVNKDNSPNLIDVEYKSAEIPVPDDYEFVSQGLVYNPERTIVEVQDNWYLPMVIVAGVCLLALGTVTIIVACNKNKKGGGADEG